MAARNTLTETWCCVLSISVVPIPGQTRHRHAPLIPSFERAQHEAVPKLEAEGWDYIWRGDRPPGHMFIKVAPHGPRTHVHMAPCDHKLWSRLYFTSSNIATKRRNMRV